MLVTLIRTDKMKRYHINLVACLFVLVALPCSIVPAHANQQSGDSNNLPENDWWLPKLESQLDAAGANRTELEKALKEIEVDFRGSLGFLIEHMPANDLNTISADMLLENVRLAHLARTRMPWGHSIPDDIFLNDVLPYANVDETREAWRNRLFEICYPIVKECRTPAEAAQALNEKLFSTINVKYSTARKRANQSPSESIDQGLASCTGLSILLTDACRSVCVPARLAGIPSWPNKRGNHTWVEVWDQDWHFTGAAEPSHQGLNHTWFQGDAALARKDSRLNAIYAISFRKTETTFPAVWSRGASIYAVNVTDRYTKPRSSPIAEGKVIAMIRVWNADKSTRIVTDVELKTKDETLKGSSRNDTADMNDMLSFAVRPIQQYQLKISLLDESMTMKLDVGSEANQVFDIAFRPAAPRPEDDESKLQAEALTAFFSASDAKADFPPSLQDALEKDPQSTRQLIWNQYLQSPLAQADKDNFDSNKVTFDEHTSPYTIKEVGKRPRNGWPLFIAMHGGGGAPARVNDSQWKHMQIYYKDQADVEGYKYLALRAPNNTWNGFYDNYVYPLIENLIAQMIAHGDVDPDKVFIMGYSHGGYGAFAIGPKIPYRFAAVHSSAAAPTDGETSAKTLRNTRFTFMVGEKDTAYGRRERCEAFAKQIEELKKANPDSYPVDFLFKEGFGHGGLPDRDMIKDMYDGTRNPTPEHLTWEQTDSVVKQFFWLSTDHPSKNQEIDAAIKDNKINVTTRDMNTFSIWLDSRLVDPGKPILVTVDGKTRDAIDYRPDVKTLCESIRRMRDPKLAFDFKIDIN